MIDALLNKSPRSPGDKLLSRPPWRHRPHEYELTEFMNESWLRQRRTNSEIDGRAHSGHSSLLNHFNSIIARHVDKFRKNWVETDRSHVGLRDVIVKSYLIESKNWEDATPLELMVAIDHVMVDVIMTSWRNGVIKRNVSCFQVKWILKRALASNQVCS